MEELRVIELHHTALHLHCFFFPVQQALLIWGCVVLLPHINYSICSFKKTEQFTKIMSGHFVSNMFKNLRTM